MANEWPDNTPTPGEPHNRAEVPIGTAEVIPNTLPVGGLAYTCQDCSASFPVDPADPFDAHGKYLDHLAQHDADEAEIEDDVVDETGQPVDCSCTWVDDPQCEYHHGPEAGY